MVSLSMVKNQGINVRLPVAATSAAQDRKDYVSITIDENGRIFWNKETVGLNDLRARLRQLKMNQADLRIFINGDAGTRFENVVSVLDEARKLGITKIAIETLKKK
jgi:biopolymer transport protein ExbD